MGASLIPSAPQRLMPDKPLVMDIGMHTGKDTAFYLGKGFRVVAIEARLDFVRECTAKFARFIESGDLAIVPFAIADQRGPVSFSVFDGHDDWGTIDKKHVERCVSRGYQPKVFTVEAITFSEVIRTYGIPYYLKIDIEGMDKVCVHQLLEFSERPKFISLEGPTRNFAECIDVVSHLHVAGYRRFKLVNQQLHYKHHCPNPPLEGRYVETRFDTLMTGPFGEEAPGHWVDAEALLVRLRRIVTQISLFGKEGRFPSLKAPYNLVRSVLGKEPLAWYDIHAAYG